VNRPRQERVEICSTHATTSSTLIGVGFQRGRRLRCRRLGASIRAVRRAATLAIVNASKKSWACMRWDRSERQAQMDSGVFSICRLRAGDWCDPLGQAGRLAEAGYPECLLAGRGMIG
jgi:hypothetical protein